MTFWSPRWRSRNVWKRHLTIPKRAQQNAMWAKWLTFLKPDFLWFFPCILGEASPPKNPKGLNFGAANLRHNWSKICSHNPPVGPRSKVVRTLQGAATNPWNCPLTNLNTPTKLNGERNLKNTQLKRLVTLGDDPFYAHFRGLYMSVLDVLGRVKKELKALLASEIVGAQWCSFLFRSCFVPRNLT